MGGWGGGGGGGGVGMVPFGRLQYILEYLNNEVILNSSMYEYQTLLQTRQQSKSVTANFPGL